MTTGIVGGAHYLAKTALRVCRSELGVVRAVYDHLRQY